MALWHRKALPSSASPHPRLQRRERVQSGLLGEYRSPARSPVPPAHAKPKQASAEIARDPDQGLLANAPPVTSSSPSTTSFLSVASVRPFTAHVKAFIRHHRLISAPSTRSHTAIASERRPAALHPLAPQARQRPPRISPASIAAKALIGQDDLAKTSLMSDYEITLINDSMQEFYVRFHGPDETPFAGGVWKIHVELPDQYPYKSPSIGFMNKIFHPNIDELSGSVCLDVINQTWSPMFDCINIFEVFLPQLLRYPNPTDPLNGEAAALLMREPKTYEARVKDYVQRFATKEAANAAGEEEDDDDDDDDEMSDVGSFSDQGEPMGDMEM
ncbi:hypothetical protein PaG_03662 [Moesziomyces aphidis]|uniref:UBC core domain-containing protein n=1 Tax=Moesziomyces aphidis TaxID=84754 RepID=W3VMT2_MOEAP|nr:hypothetical protein PaG_03662 [Moesziomyces aphidis]